MDTPGNTLDSYYADAKSWFAIKYFSPYTQLLYIIIATVFVVFAVINIINLIFITTDIERIPFPIYIDDEVNDRPNIKHIGIENESTNFSIAHYLCSEYVKTIEVYSPIMLSQDQLIAKLNYIANISSKQVLSEYTNKLNTTENKNSPFLKYNVHTKRTIDVISVHFVNNIMRPSNAIVNFKATEISDIDPEKGSDAINDNNNNHNKNVSYWRAELDFIMNDMVDSIRYQQTGINFVVIKYNVSYIGNDITSIDTIAN